jgi:hypothetical protein
MRCSLKSRTIVDTVCCDSSYITEDTHVPHVTSRRSSLSLSLIDKKLVQSFAKLPSHLSTARTTSRQQCLQNHEDEQARVRAQVEEEELPQAELRTAPAKQQRPRPRRRLMHQQPATLQRPLYPRKRVALMRNYLRPLNTTLLRTIRLLQPQHRKMAPKPRRARPCSAWED